MRCKSATTVPWSHVIYKGRVMRLIHDRHMQMSIQLLCRIYDSFAMST